MPKEEFKELRVLLKVTKEELIVLLESIKVLCDYKTIKSYSDKDYGYRTAEGLWIWNSSINMLQLETLHEMYIKCRRDCAHYVNKI